MARPANNDPLDKFRWAVSVQADGQESFVRLGFTRVEVPSVKISTKSYPEGGNHLFPKKIIESVEYPPIVLERGVTDNLDFHNWATGYVDLYTGVRKDGAKDYSALERFNKRKQGFLDDGFIENTLPDNIVNAPGYVTNGSPVGPSTYRRNLVIRHQNREGEVVKTYVIYNAFPIEYKPASDFNSTADDGYSMERLVLAYESFEVIATEQDANPFDVSDIFKRVSRNLF